MHAETHSETLASVKAELQGDTLFIMHKKKEHELFRKSLDDV